MDSHSGCTSCTVVGWIKAVVFAVIGIIAVWGAYNAHFPVTGFDPGTIDASLSLLAASAALVVFFKAAKKLCSCGGCDCGSNCNCGH